MSVRERRPQIAEDLGNIHQSGSVELAHTEINIRNQLDRNYLDVAAAQTGDVQNAWLNFRRTGEVRYAITRSARIAGYGQFRAVEVDRRGNIIKQKEDGVEADIVSSITSRFGGVRGLIERFYMQMKIPGQTFPIRLRSGGIDGNGDVDGYWFLSGSEINKEGQLPSNGSRPSTAVTWTMRPKAQNQQAFTRQVQAKDFLGRIWVPDPEYTDLAASPMSTINGMCEQLHDLTQSISGRLRQRFALAGILLIPTEINNAAVSGSKPRDNLYSDDKVMNYLIHVMTTNVVNHSQGIAQIPILLKGPAAVLDKVTHIVMEAQVAETDLKLRAELIDRILTTLDQQKQAVSGGEGTNHWGMWAVSDEERRITVQPDLEMLCHALTRMILWPELSARDRRQGNITKWRVWYDLSSASVRSNLSEDARQAYDRGAVSPAFLRLQSGAAETDAPSPEEYIQMVGWKMNNPILATYGLEGVEVDWDRAAAWGKQPGPAAESSGDDPESSPGGAEGGDPNNRDTDTPKSQEPG